MGVDKFILDRRTVPLLVGGTMQSVGTLRQFFKITELDKERIAELEVAEQIKPSPVAVMVLNQSDLAFASDPETPVAAHLVLGWDEGRGSVAEYYWEFLPELGYAVRDPQTGQYALYECRDDLLYEIDATRAHELGLLDLAGRLVRQGQPVITACKPVRAFLDRYAEADCVLSSGRQETLMTIMTGGGKLPPSD